MGILLAVKDKGQLLPASFIEKASQSFKAGWGIAATEGGAILTEQDQSAFDPKAMMENVELFKDGSMIFCASDAKLEAKDIMPMPILTADGKDPYVVGFSSDPSLFAKVLPQITKAYARVGGTSVDVDKMFDDEALKDYLELLGQPNHSIVLLSNSGRVLLSSSTQMAKKLSFGWTNNDLGLSFQDPAKTVSQTGGVSDKLAALRARKAAEAAKAAGTLDPAPAPAPTETKPEEVKPTDTPAQDSPTHVWVVPDKNITSQNKIDDWYNKAANKTKTQVPPKEARKARVPMRVPIDWYKQNKNRMDLADNQNINPNEVYKPFQPATEPAEVAPTAPAKIDEAVKNAPSGTVGERIAEAVTKAEQKELRSSITPKPGEVTPLGILTAEQKKAIQEDFLPKAEKTMTEGTIQAMEDKVPSAFDVVDSWLSIQTYSEKDFKTLDDMGVCWMVAQTLRNRLLQLEKQVSKSAKDVSRLNDPRTMKVA